MELFPAIDLSGGAVVRLTQGDYDRKETYSDNPVETARQFVERGARNLHVVDLDGAKDGAPANLDAIRALVDVGLFTQVGGGIRDEKRVYEYLALGVERVILGTVAVENFAFLERMVRMFGKRIAVGVDARDGKVAVKGWRETTALDGIEFCKRLEKAGVRTIIYTDIARDGAMRGTNLELYRELVRELSCDIVASGGICTADEVEILRNMGLYGAILGKALYTGAIDLAEVSALC